VQEVLTFCAIWLLTVAAVLAATDRRRYRALAQWGAVSMIVAAFGVGIALALAP
jgi:hypothetical protein